MFAFFMTSVSYTTHALHQNTCSESSIKRNHTNISHQVRRPEGLSNYVHSVSLSLYYITLVGILYHPKNFFIFEYNGHYERLYFFGILPTDVEVIRSLIIWLRMKNWTLSLFRRVSSANTEDRYLLDAHTIGL